MEKIPHKKIVINVIWTFHQRVEGKMKNMNLQSLTIMGGVETDKLADTLGAGTSLNRLSCATMNQLYHPERAAKLFQLFEGKLHIVTNNEVNRNFAFNAMLPEGENRLGSYKLMRKILGNIDESVDVKDDMGVWQHAYKYYSNPACPPPPFKPFDYLTAYVMCNEVIPSIESAQKQVNKVQKTYSSIRNTESLLFQIKMK